jgi:hypothetical protein
MALKPQEQDILNLIVKSARRVLNVVDEAADIATMFSELGMVASVGNAELTGGNYNFNKTQLTEALAVLAALNAVLTAENKAKLYRVAAPRQLVSL